MVILPTAKKFKKLKPSTMVAKTVDGSGNATETNDDSVSKDILVIAQEVKIVQSLACNDVNKRNRQMRKLRKWLQLRSRSSFAFTEEDFMRIWKGLYYNFWMSDKPLVQEELAEQMGQLIECFDGDITASVNFFGAFMRTMCQEWFGIDQWRIDKFLLLVRRLLRYMFRALRSGGWSVASVKRFNEHMLQTVLAEDTTSTGLIMHYLDIFFEELAKVSEGKISADQVGAFARPFAFFIGTQRDVKLVSHCRNRIFYHLLYQSTLGREYCEKYNAWKEMGFPTASINDLEKDDTESATEDDVPDVTDAPPNQRHLDPRAGNVDVFMPVLPLDAKHIIDELELLIYKRESRTKCRNMLKKLLEVFRTYQSGEFPLGIKTMPHIELKAQKPLILDKISQLENLENEMYGTSRKLKQLNKRKRRKLLKSLNFEDFDESNFEQMIEKAIPKNYLKERERKKRAQGAMMNGWLEEEIEIDEVTPKKKRKKNIDNLKETVIKVSELNSKHKNQVDEPDEPTEKGLQLESIAEHKLKTPIIAHKENTVLEESTAKQVEVIKKKKKQEPVAEVARNISPVLENGVIEKSEQVANSVTLKSSTKHGNSKKLSEWDDPLTEGEIEYFIPSRKLQLKKANSDFVLNPLAKKQLSTLAQSTPSNSSKRKPTAVSRTATNTPITPASVKRVKIALKHNTIQNPSEYIKQIKSSPNVPYDAEKKPSKGLLKPHSIPSPINPFYKKKIGLRLLNDTI